MLDFGKIGTSNTIDTLLSPREIFTALPKETPKYQYPRDVQSQVWSQWFARKDERDLVLKMNTGSGKTVVGLLILKSCLNEGKGPAVFIVPDKYLVEQVVNEAKSLGLDVTTDAKSSKFLRGKEILITNIFKLVNGKSVFGVGESIKINIGSMVLDDAHACIDTIEEQFTMKIKVGTDAYDELIKLFNSSLVQQCESKAIDIRDNNPGSYMQVPFWKWQEKISEVIKILAKNQDADDIKFTWPLLKEDIKFCNCVIGGTEIEISSHCIPINMIPSIEQIKRKIFMTATLVDDSVLVSHFDLNSASIEQAIFPETAGDIGERMILVPQEINIQISDDKYKEFYKSLSKSMNVVVIVPSVYRAKYWKDVVDLEMNKDNLYEGVEKLKSGHVGLAILINRYDGIDLPGNACRVLVIDGLPDFSRYIDSLNEGILMENNRILSKKIQKIEQGMGRGVRSNDDFCVVFLMGKSLTNNLYIGNTKSMFSPGTQAQLTLSEQVTEQIEEKGLKAIEEVINYCLSRDGNWVSASKGVLASLHYDSERVLDDIAVGLRSAYNEARKHNSASSVQIISTLVNQTTDDLNLKGYLKQVLAEYTNLLDTVEAQKILKSAIDDNRRVLKPINGISYQKLGAVDEQAQVCKNNLLKYESNTNKLIIEIDAILDALSFIPNTANKFEESIKKIAGFLGFSGQRPENDFGRGPDNLWATGGLHYFVIECKNGTTTGNISKHDINQLNGSVNWFEDMYDQTCTCTPIMIHCSLSREHAASPHKDMLIMNEEKLELFKSKILQFIKSIKDNLNDTNKIRSALIACELRQSDILVKYMDKIK